MSECPKSRACPATRTATECGRAEGAADEIAAHTDFATAFLSALLWFESDERNYTPAQKTALLVTSLTAWGLMLFLGAIMT